MKLLLFYLTLLLTTFAQIAHSQPFVDWQLVGNVVAGGQFLGTTNPQPLHLQTVLGQPIRFRTNFGAAPLGFGNRMIITDGGFGNNGGQIAIGNSLPDGFIPVDRLHLHQNGGNTFIRFSNTVFTGSGPNDGMRFGMLCFRA